MNFTPAPAQIAPLKARGLAEKALLGATERTGRDLGLIEGAANGRPEWFVREWQDGTCTETGWMGLGQLVSYLGGLK